MIGTLLTFALMCLLLAVTPGPDTFLVLRSTAVGGARAGIGIAAGSATGSLVWASFAALGLATLIEQWPSGFNVLRVLGAVYLGYLGVRSLMARPGDMEDTAAATAAGSPFRAWRAGTLSAVLNPKIGLFFLAIAPQFLPEGQSVAVLLLLLGVVDAIVAFIWLAIVGVVAATLIRWLARPKITLVLERGTGIALIGVGLSTLIATA